jgi:tRNA nucleotidyltransferase/poly(A) polymerase
MTTESEKLPSLELPSLELPSLSGAPWLAEPRVRRVFALLTAGGEEARIAGGAVRDALLGRPVGEIDFATTATPEVVMAAAAAAGIKAVPTGIEHGTVTLVVEGTAYEVTTLRQDITTDGRHAVVRFGRDWRADAERRDFTMNALSIDGDGILYDPIRGYPDLVAGRVRFIGGPDVRIAEDRLRILRFFRFNARYGQGAVDAAGLSACIRARNTLRDLSAERIGQEIRRIVTAPRAVEIATLMQESGILPVVLGGIAYLRQFDRAVRAETAAGAPSSAATRLAALSARVSEDIARISARLRLSNAERARMLATLAAAGQFAPFPDERAARRLLYRLGEEAFRDGVFQAFAWSYEPPGDAWKALYHLPDRWQPPAFPLGGRDVIAAGTARGPLVGEALRAVETWWIGEDFAPDEALLRRRLQQMIAAQQ